jgi:hypothetical protein
MKSKKTKQIDRWVRRNEDKHFCHCGCGYTIEIKREHFKPSVGIPKFIKGHNLTPVPEEFFIAPPPVVNPWDNLSPEEKERRLSFLKNFQSGDKNPAWKGGRRVDENGYVQILVPGHPFAKDNYVAEHRLAVEERTKKYYPDHPLLVVVDGEKYLSPASVVHHIDEVKTNNYTGSGAGDDGNLMLLPNQSAHAFIHMSPLPMEERLRRISLGIYHSGPINEDVNKVGNDEN